MFEKFPLVRWCQMSWTLLFQVSYRDIHQSAVTGRVHRCRNWFNQRRCVPSWKQGVSARQRQAWQHVLVSLGSAAQAQRLEFPGVKQFFSVCLHLTFYLLLHLELSWPVSWEKKREQFPGVDIYAGSFFQKHSRGTNTLRHGWLQRLRRPW